MSLKEKAGAIAGAIHERTDGWKELEEILREIEIIQAKRTYSLKTKINNHEFVLGFAKQDEENLWQLFSSESQQKVSVKIVANGKEIPVQIIHPAKSGAAPKEEIGPEQFEQNKFVHVTFSLKEKEYEKQQKKQKTEKPTNIEILSCSGLQRLSVDNKCIRIYNTTKNQHIYNAILNVLPLTIRVIDGFQMVEQVDQDMDTRQVSPDCGTNQMTRQVDHGFETKEFSLARGPNQMAEQGGEDLGTREVSPECEQDEPDLHVVVTLKTTRVQCDAESAIEKAGVKKELKDKTVLLIFHKVMGCKTVEDVENIIYRNESVNRTIHVPFRTKD